MNQDFPIVPVVAIMIPIIIVPFSLLFKYLGRERQMEHAERMKALEVGRTLTQDEPFWSAPKIAVAIGAGVPAVSMAVALLCMEAIGFHEVVWIAAAGVSITGIIGGTTLAGKHFNHRANMELAALNASHYLPNAKPALDPDAYDVASSRG